MNRCIWRPGEPVKSKWSFGETLQCLLQMLEARRLVAFVVLILGCVALAQKMGGGFGKQSDLQSELFIVPQANVLSGIGQKPSAKMVSSPSRQQHPKKASAHVLDLTDSAHWSPAMVSVQEQVLKEIAKQRADRASMMAKKAAQSYQSKLYSSLQTEKARANELAGQKRAALNSDYLDTFEKSEEAKTEARSFRQAVQARRDEISSERADENSRASDTYNHYSDISSAGLPNRNAF